MSDKLTEFQRDPIIIRDVKEQTRYLFSEAVETSRIQGPRSHIETVRVTSAAVRDKLLYGIVLSATKDGQQQGNEMIKLFVPPAMPGATIEEMSSELRGGVEEPFSADEVYFGHLFPAGQIVTTHLTDELTSWTPDIDLFSYGTALQPRAEEDIDAELEQLVTGQIPQPETRAPQYQLTDGQLDMSAYILDLLSQLSNEMDFSIVPQNG